MGEWMKINSEVIYGSRGTKKYKQDENIRYIQSSDEKYVYAASLIWPGKELILTNVIVNDESEIYMLGVNQALPWSVTNEGKVVIVIPESLQDETNRPCKYAWCFKIEGTPVE